MLGISGLRLHPWILVIPLLLVIVVAPVHGSLWPTKPVRDTTYTAGQPAQVTWIEDGKAPLLNTTFGMRIDLYAGKNTFVATLAKNVAPSELSATLFIPSTIPDNYHYFNLRFVIPQPPTIIYTADFNIMPNYISKPPASEAQANPSAARQAVVTVTSTITSRISGSQQAAEPSSTPSMSAGTFWSPANRPHKTGSIDIEKIKFRLLFVVWPSLVGLSLAL